MDDEGTARCRTEKTMNLLENPDARRGSTTSRGGTFADQSAGTSVNQWDARQRRQEAEKAAAAVAPPMSIHELKYWQDKREEQEREERRQREQQEREKRQAEIVARQRKIGDFRAREILVAGALEGLSESEKAIVMNRLVSAGRFDPVLATMFAREVEIARTKQK
jgi:hypothetical protein